MFFLIVRKILYTCWLLQVDVYYLTQGLGALVFLFSSIVKYLKILHFRMNGIMFFINLAITIAIIVTICQHNTSAQNNNPSKVPPRDALIKALEAAGCKNKYVAHYVIDSYYSGVPVSVLAQRLAPITGYTVPQLSKWVAALSTHIKNSNKQLNYY